MAQLAGCWTHNPKVMGSIPKDANCFMWDNILGQDVNLDCASPPSGKYGYPAIRLPRVAILTGVILCNVLYANNRKKDAI